MKKYEKKLPTVLTKEEIKEFFEKIDNFRDSLLFKLIYFTGARVGEILTLQFEDINMKEGFIKLHSEKKRSGQMTQRLIRIPKELNIALKNYLSVIQSQEGKVFTLTACRVWQLLKKYIERTSIQKKKVTVHTLRHSYATYLLSKTGNLELVRDILGHEDITTTRLYTHLTTGDKGKLIDKAFEDW